MDSGCAAGGEKPASLRSSGRTSPDLLWTNSTQFHWSEAGHGPSSCSSWKPRRQPPGVEWNLVSSISRQEARFYNLGNCRWKWFVVHFRLWHCAWLCTVAWLWLVVVFEWSVPALVIGRVGVSDITRRGGLSLLFLAVCQHPPWCRWMVK